MWKTGYRPLNVYRNLRSGGAVRWQGEIGWLFSTFSIANCNNPKSLKWIKLLNHQIGKSLKLIMNHNPSSTHWKCSKSPQVWESLGGGNGAAYALWKHGVAHQRGGGRRRVVYPVLRISYFVFLSQKEKKTQMWGVSKLDFGLPNERKSLCQHIIPFWGNFRVRCSERHTAGPPPLLMFGSPWNRFFRCLGFS